MFDDLPSSLGLEAWSTGDPTPLFDRAIRLTPEQVAQALRSGHLLDRAFDRFLPLDLQALSSMYWTPLQVVQRAARWLSDLDVRTVVDVGSGSGKFCVAAALTSDCRFLGLEQRPRLVAAARALAELFAVEDRVEFVEGTLGETDVPPADAYYFFNPFGENLYGAGDNIDEDVELSDERYGRDVAIAEDLLRRVPAGTFLLTYNGFGGRVPEGYQEVRVDREMPSVLRMWQKVREPGTAGVIRE